MRKGFEMPFNLIVVVAIMVTLLVILIISLGSGVSGPFETIRTLVSGSMPSSTEMIEQKCQRYCQDFLSKGGDPRNSDYCTKYWQVEGGVKHCYDYEFIDCSYKNEKGMYVKIDAGECS